MNAQEIKNILIAYLKAANREIRIYQEKSIGDAVCDLMTVTNCLTGYEIKSDLDNYQRLGRQIRAYDLFFEQNYIVVGGRHLNSAARRVPDHWGIITIQSAQVVIHRAARTGKPDCARQLSALWTIELTNLLTKAGLPLYTSVPTPHSSALFVCRFGYPSTVLLSFSDSLSGRFFRPIGSLSFFLLLRHKPTFFPRRFLAFYHRR